MSEFIQIGRFAVAVEQIIAVEFDHNISGAPVVDVLTTGERSYRFAAEARTAFLTWWENYAHVHRASLPPAAGAVAAPAQE